MKKKILYVILFIIIIGSILTIVSYTQSRKNNKYNNVIEKTSNEEHNNSQENNNNNSEKDNKYLYGYAFRSGFISNMTSLDSKIIVTNYESLEDYCNKYNNYVYDGHGNILYGNLDELLKQYANDFFQEKSLAIQYVETTSGSDEVQFISASIINENAVKVNYKIIRQEIGTCDMSGYLIIVEVAKDVINII